MGRRLLILGLAGAYGAALLLVGLWPTHVDENMDMVNRPPTTWLVNILSLTPAQGYDIGEFSANVLLFVPLGLLAMGLVPRLSWVRLALGAGALSVLIELAQTIYRPDRTGSLRDVVANTFGAVLGAALVVAWRQLRSRAKPQVGGSMT
jgi:glycopeptide antibiotics resistance protein